jgi:homoserine acetyltransferase
MANNSCLHYTGDHKSYYSTESFENGYYSHIRGEGSHLAPHTKVFPGTQPMGNPAGINAPLMLDTRGGDFIILKRNYDGNGIYDVVQTGNNYCS